MQSHAIPGLSPTERAASGRRFTVASYNIHGCVGKDLKRDAARIARVISELDADIVGLQEVDSRVGEEAEAWQMDYLAHATGLKAVAGPAIARHDRHYGNLLLTRHRILDVRRLDLSVSGQEPRGALDVDLQIRHRVVRVLITHFGLRAAERRYQAQRLLAALKEDTERLTLVLGDFNEWSPFSRSLQSLQARLGPTPAPRTYPAFFPLLPLDRIWVCPPAALLDLRTHHNAMTRVCSDHLPIRAVVSLDAE